MILKKYLEEEEISRAEFAQAMGVTPATVSRWAAGKITPTIRSAQKIEAITFGAVTVEDFEKLRELKEIWSK